MRFVPRISVGTRLTVAIFLVVVLSWVISAGTSSYVAYQRMRVLRQEMLARPDLYPVPIPEPKFGVMDLLTGPRPGLDRPQGPPPGPPQGRPGLVPPPPQPRPGPPPGPKPGPPLGIVGVLVIALMLAALAGKLLSRTFSRRLSELEKGAGAFHSGDLGYRIPEGGDDEFGHVATAMNEMAANVSDHINQLEEEAERRRQFLADVAHELRSPVATMRTMAGALEDGVAGDPERRSRAIGSLSRTSERLLHLVSDLLELARLDLKELPIHARQVDLRELASNTVSSHAASAAGAGVTLLPVEAGPPVMASVDPDRIAQVLDNLLDNAISYAGERAEVQVNVEGGKPVRIIVSDNGRGIAVDHLPHIFEPFYRADSARTPAEGHSGLGLRISRGLVEAHGGTLSLTSSSAGTTVTILL